MPRRASIARQMIAMVLIGIDLALIRTWIVPTLRPGTMPVREVAANSARLLGELGPMVALVLVALAVAVATAGRTSRFGVGAALAGLFASALFFLSPDSIRHATFNQVVVRLQYGGRFRANIVPSRGLGDGTLLRMFEDFNGNHSWSGLVRCPFIMPSSQVYLGLVLTPFALLGGAFFAAFRVDPGSVAIADSGEIRPLDLPSS